MSEHNETGIRELKTHLSAYLREVKAGKTIVITEHGEPIGQLVPIAESVDKKLERLVESGVVDWSGEQFEPAEPAAETKGETTVADLVTEERDTAAESALERNDGAES